MSSHKHYITCSFCCNKDTTPSNNQKQRQQQIYRTVSIKLEQQLRALQNRKNCQIQALAEQNRNQRFQKEKNIIKLNLMKDLQTKTAFTVQQLQDQIIQLKNKIFSLQVRSLHSNLREVIKEVVVKEPLNEYYSTKIENLQKQVQQLKSKNQQQTIEINSIKFTNQILYTQLEQKQNLVKSKQKHLKSILQQNRNLVYDMQQTKLVNQKYHQQLKQLREIQPVVIQKQKIKEIPVMIQQYQKNLFETNPIETIYVDRIVQKVTLVQVNKLITQFVEPQRPMVTRIINCGDSVRNKSNCGCGSHALQ